MKKLSELALLPRPREITNRTGTFAPGPGSRVLLRGDPRLTHPAGLRIREELAASCGLACRVEAGDGESGQPIILQEREPQPGAGGVQGYVIRIGTEAVRISAAGAAGMLHAASTLCQALRECAGPLPCGEISDSPDFPVRGVMLDVSRDKVPTMETLYLLVDMMGELKLNHLELYTEHTFAYSAHRDVWAEASPLTGEEILLLDSRCRERHIELVPNQNSFGHMTRWLTLPRYRDLAACPDGCVWPWDGKSGPPFSLDPSSPASLEFLDGLYSELLPHFTSGMFNVGFDETFDIDQGKNRERCAREGKGRVYLDFLRKVHELVRRRGKTMTYWADVVAEHPEVVPELPRDAVAMEWGYEAGHPFDERCARLAGAGIPFYVCPGTSSWNSLAGRTTNALSNLRSAAESGLRHGAAGYLTTDWGDNGHWQALPVSFLGLAAGASYSWCLSENAGRDLAAALDLHVFRDSAGVMGGLARDLGDVYLRAGAPIHNGSPLFHILWRPSGSPLPDGVTVGTLGAARELIGSCSTRLSAARMHRPDGELIRDEMANTARLMSIACDRGIAVCRGETHEAPVRQRFARDMSAILGEYRRLWLGRNRIGGLSESVRIFEGLLRESRTA